jgi:hypothetical protein
MTSRSCISHRLDISGNRYGKLTAMSDVGKNRHGKRLWLVRCDCGNEKTVVVSSLVNGHSKSCGYCSTQKIWTEEEKRFLVDNHEKYTHQKLAKTLNRSLKSVQLKCLKMGLRALESVKREALSEQRRGAKNPNWKGDECNLRTGNDRARRLYPHCPPCVICGELNSERHHKDGNPRNNKPDNIVFLCRRHHMEADNRLKHLKQNQKEAHT